jgi:hypothetical protein
MPGLTGNTAIWTTEKQKPSDVTSKGLGHLEPLHCLPLLANFMITFHSDSVTG